MKTIKFGKPIISDDEKNAVLDVLSGDTLVHGPKAKEFENAFANFAQAPNAISVSSCTAGLHLSYFTFGIAQGDEVIVPAETHVATVHAVELAGAKPIFVDAELKTGNIDIDQIEGNITDNVKAISIVHFLGMPVNMQRIIAIAEKYNLKVIEDCALAIGSKINDKHVGLFGDTGCFSFYPVKHITTAEGGMIITKHNEVSNKLSYQKAFGVDRIDSERKIPGQYDVPMLGFNYRMNEIQAAIGIEQMKKIENFLSIRDANYTYLENALRNIQEIQLFQSSYNEFKSSYYCLTIILKNNIAAKRYEIVRYMKNKGIGTSIYYPHPVPFLKYYKNKYNLHDKLFPNAKTISYNSIALPIGPHLTIEDMDFIANILKNAIMEHR